MEAKGFYQIHCDSARFSPRASRNLHRVAEGVFESLYAQQRRGVAGLDIEHLAKYIIFAHTRIGVEETLLSEGLRLELKVIQRVLIRFEMDDLSAVTDSLPIYWLSSFPPD